MCQHIMMCYDMFVADEMSQSKAKQPPRLEVLGAVLLMSLRLLASAFS